MPKSSPGLNQKLQGRAESLSLCRMRILLSGQSPRIVEEFAVQNGWRERVCLACNEPMRYDLKSITIIIINNFWQKIRKRN